MSEGSRYADASAPAMTSLTLLERVRTEDERAWEQLVLIYGPLVYDWCRHQGLQAADSADMLQEVFRAVWRKIGDFRRDRAGGSFRGWLWTIAHNKIRDHCRAQRAGPKAIGGTAALRRWQDIPGSEKALLKEATRISTVSVDSPLRRALELVKSEFRPATWRAFWQVAVEGRQTADVAADLGISNNAVRLAKSRVLRRVREKFGDILA